MGFPGGHLTSRYFVCLFVICLFTGLLWLFLCMCVCVCVAVNYEWTWFLVCVSRTVPPSETKRNTNRTAPVSATLYTSMHMHIIYPVKGTWVSGVYRIRPLQKSLSCLLGFQALHTESNGWRLLSIRATTPTARHPSSHSLFLSFFLSLSLWSMQNSHAHVSLSLLQSAKK